MNQIEVAFLSPYVYPLFKPDCPAAFGGAEVDQYNLAVYLAKNPHIRVTFYVGDFGQPDQPETIDGVRLVKIPYYGWHNKTLSQKVHCYSHLWLNLWQSPARLMLTKMAGDEVGWAAIFFKNLRKRYILHRLASDRDTKFFDASSSGGRRTYYLYRIGLKRADLIFSQSEQQQKLLKDNMGFESQVVSNGFFVEEEIDITGKQHILWVGRCTALKRPELFVELAKRIPTKRFVMIMSPPIEVEPEIFKRMAVELVNEAKTLPNMIFMEYVPFNKIQSFFNQAQLFVNTSEYEGFPNTFIQSCLGGTPIASLKVDPDEFIARNKLGIACDDNFDNLVKYVKNLNSDQVGALGAKARAYGRKHHDINVIGGLYEEAIEKLLKT